MTTNKKPGEIIQRLIEEIFSTLQKHGRNNIYHDSNIGPTKTTTRTTIRTTKVTIGTTIRNTKATTEVFGIVA